MLERLDILRRIAERGKRLAEAELQLGDTTLVYVDLFVHLLDEIERTKNYYETYEEIE